MAFAVDVFANTRPVGTTISRFSRSFRFISGASLIGAGFAASAWVVTTIATMHAIAPEAKPAMRIALTAKTAAPEQAHQRLIHVTKFSRLATSDADKLAQITKDGRAAAHARLASALVGKSAPITIAEASPDKTATVVAAAAPADKAKDDLLALQPAPVAADKNSADRIVIPSKEEVAAITGTNLLALAAASDEKKVAALPSNNRKGNEQAVEVASAATDTDVKDADPAQSFDLVLTDRESSVPLPMARPDALAKRPQANDRTQKPAEPVLAYARPDVGDDEGEIPTVPKRQSNPIARAGVAVYDISASMVYLPSGERLEAHSGLGKMRDNPRYVHEKMRGPTPPHTYTLTMRESLFHGVEAIRLTPVGGAANIYNRVGLLAHTYMLGARGDSNGCVSFKDYRRFLAAFKRGDIRQLVVVTSMPSKPSSTLASLFSSRS